MSTDQPIAATFAESGFDSVGEYIDAKRKNLPRVPSPSDIMREVRSEMETFVGTKTQIEQAEIDAKTRAKHRQKDAWTAYRKSECELDAEFHELLQDEYGTRGNLKEPQLFEIALEYGQNSGYVEVENYYRRLSELIV